MNVWDKYQSVSVARGMSRREASIIRESRMLESKIINSLSFHKVNIDGVPREVSIDNSDNLNEKIIRSLPGEDLDCGGLVEWADNFWLIVEKDANNEIRSYT